MCRFAREPGPPHWRRRGILTTLLLFLLLSFAPLRAGDVGLALGVDYTRVKLPARAPASISLDLPPGEYFVEPASLGYFTQANQFVYTADEPRGLIYGRQRDKVVLIELQAPARAEEFISDYLDRIRGAVAQLNSRENELLLARQGFAAKSDRVKQLASIPLSQTSEELAVGGFDEWCARCSVEGAEVAARAPAALGQSVSDRTELKRLYYESQKARLTLTLRNFDLQMALARLPRPRFAEVLGGGQQTVRDTLRARLGELRDQWHDREVMLRSQQRMDQAGLALHSGLLAAGAPQGQALAAPAQQSIGLQTLADFTGSGDTLRSQVLQSRIALDDSELAMLADAQAQLDDAVAYIDAGGLVDGAQLTALTVRASDFAPLDVAALPQLALLEEQSAQPKPAAELLLELARMFESPEQSGELKLTSNGFVQVACSPQEAAYGLLIVDRCRRVDSGDASMADGPELAALLGQMVAKPGDYGAAENDLGYLAFMRWYAQQNIGAPTAQAVAGRVKVGNALSGLKLIEDKAPEN